MKLTNTFVDPSASTDHVPSIDRIDDSKGYTKENVWVISFQANRMKNTASRTELTTFAQNWLKLNKDIQ